MFVLLYRCFVLQGNLFTLRVGTGAIVSAVAVGIIEFHFQNNSLYLDNVYFIPGFKRNLISVGRLFEQCYDVSFNNKCVIISRNGVNICSANLENCLYTLRPNNQSLLNTELFKVEQPKSKKQKISHDNDIYHINLNKINKLVKDGL